MYEEQSGNQLLLIVSCAIFLVLSAGCAGQPSNSTLARQCEKGLSIAQKEFEAAQSRGFGGTVALVKASSLLGAAGVQKEFGKYPNCVDKVKRARYYIKQAIKGKSS